MGLFLRQQGPRTELQSKVAAELQERIKKGQPVEGEKTDPAFTENQQQTNGIGIVIAVLVVIFIIAIAWLVS